MLSLAFRVFPPRAFAGGRAGEVCFRAKHGISYQPGFFMASTYDEASGSFFTLRERILSVQVSSRTECGMVLLCGCV
jgi:hypothetical protein